jgi:hypothetical protein
MPGRTAAVCLMTAFLVAGCGSPAVHLASEPPGAHLLLDGRLRGRTPLGMQAHYPGLRALELNHPGYRPEEVLADLRPSPPWWLFPFDFPLELVRALSRERDQDLRFVLERAAAEAGVGPTEGEILALARRARALGLRRVR